MKPPLLHEQAETEKPPSQQQKRIIEDTWLDIPPEATMGAPIKKIAVVSPLLKTEIQQIVSDMLLDKTSVADDLALVRQHIWKLGVDHKRLLHTKFRVIPYSKDSSGSWLVVEVSEIVVRKVLVEPEGDVQQSILSGIEKEASREFFQNKVLDLGELENNIKTRLRLGDVRLHTSVVPIDPTHVDLKIEVSSVPEARPAVLVQYDNEGGWSFGRDRLIGGVSFSGVKPGDTITLMGMKSADIGNWDVGDGTYFGRFEYQAPIGQWGVRLETWASGLHYHEIKAVSSNARANGEALEFGQGVVRPLFVGEHTAIDARADFVARYSVDRTSETVRTGEKAAYLGRLRISLDHQVSESSLFQFSMTLSEGVTDLSGDKPAYIQDQLGPKANGIFTKIEEEANWSGKLGSDGKIDFTMALKGQWTPNNLDSTEKFSLGGAKGLRAYGNGEAPGDAGLIFSKDVGYLLDGGTHPYIFSDAGVVWRSINPWSSAGTNCYHLLDVGAGISQSIDNVNLSLVFAHQLGGNSGPSSQGLDADNTSQRYRVWAALSYRY